MTIVILEGQKSCIDCIYSGGETFRNPGRYDCFVKLTLKERSDYHAWLGVGRNRLREKVSSCHPDVANSCNDYVERENLRGHIK